MFQPGRRWFSSASIALLLVALLHTIGHFALAPDDPEATNVVEVMQSYRLPFPMGMNPSFLEIFKSLSLTMGVTLVALGLQNLAAARAADSTDTLLRQFTWLSVLAVGGLVAIYGYYRVFPPLVTLRAVEIMFLLALLIPATPRASRAP